MIEADGATPVRRELARERQGAVEVAGRERSVEVVFECGPIFGHEQMFA